MVPLNIRKRLVKMVLSHFFVENCATYTNPAEATAASENVSQCALSNSEAIARGAATARAIQAGTRRNGGVQNPVF